MKYLYQNKMYMFVNSGDHHEQKITKNVDIMYLVKIAINIKILEFRGRLGT